MISATETNSLTEGEILSMTLEQQMEQLSLAYIRAVAANLGYQVTKPDPDVDSVDGTLLASFGRRPRIDFQAKATTQDILRGQELHFQLPVNNYEDLRADTVTPRMLIVLIMPKDQSDWLNQTQNELCLRRCAYWLSLEGRPSTSNKHTITVEIPVSNLFDSGQLRDLMEKAEMGVALC